MDNENVLKMPTLLERLASKLHACLSLEAANHEGWIVIQETKCALLVEIRDVFKDDDFGFGQWCNDNGFGKNVLNDHTRAACIAMGRDPVALRKCLESTTRRSLHTIYKYEFEGFENVFKPPNRRTQTRRTDTKTTEVAAAIRPLVEAGDVVSEQKLAEQFGVSRTTVYAAKERELGRLEGLAERPPLDRADMTKTMQARYEAAVRKAREELRAEITAEIGAAYQGMIDQTQKRVVQADRIIAAHQGVISREAFRKIKACLHPDHNTFTHAAEALQTFSALERVLVKAEDVAPTAQGLPRTAAEMMARRRRP